MSFWQAYSGKKVIITGDTGFKGSWLAIWLKQLGAQVYGYALPPKSDQDNFAKCNLTHEIFHLDGDIRDGLKLKTYFNKIQPDFAFHLAAQPLVLLSYADPLVTFETNLMGTVNFLEAVRATPSIKAAVNVTTDKCYDNKEWIWGYRENDPMGGKDPYSASKGCSELITHSYIESFFNQSQTCNLASARAGNVIGGGDWAIDRIVPDYFRAMARSEKLVIRNPDATRPWQHVLEPLSGYLNLGARLFLEGKRFIGAWNFGPEESSNHSVRELIDTMISLHSNTDYLMPKDNQKFHEAGLLKLDISKAVNLLKWRPALTFDQTVSFTMNGYFDDLNEDNTYVKRVNQIELYTEVALTKNIEWAQ